MFWATCTFIGRLKRCTCPHEVNDCAGKYTVYCVSLITVANERRGFLEIGQEFEHCSNTKSISWKLALSATDLSTRDDCLPAEESSSKSSSCGRTLMLVEISTLLAGHSLQVYTQLPVLLRLAPFDIKYSSGMKKGGVVTSSLANVTQIMKRSHGVTKNSLKKVFSLNQLA